MSAVVDKADVVVIGSGPGGAIPAYRLAAAGAKVVVLERGPWLETHEFTHDLRIDSYTKIIDYITAELHSDRAHAILSLAALVGATSLAAQVGADRALAEEILKTTHQELLKCRPAAKKKTAKAAAHSEADA